MKLITVGRSNKNNVVVNDIQVSDEHAQIVVKDNGLCSIVDLNSSNGTFVNDVRISGETPLKAGDRVRVGNSTLPWQNYIESGSQRKLAVAPSTPTPAPSGGAPQKNGAKRWVVIILAIIIIALMIIGVMGYMWSSSNNTNATKIKGYKAQIDSLKTEMEDRDRRIIYYDGEYLVLAADNGKLNDTVEANRRELAAKVNLIKAKDAEIVNLNNTITERNAEIGKLEDTIKVRNARIGDLNGIINDKNKEIGNLNGINSMNSLKIINLSNTITEKNADIDTLKKTITANNAEIDRLNGIIKEKEEEINKLNNSPNDGQKQTKKDEAQVEQQTATQMTEGKEK